MLSLLHTYGLWASLTGAYILLLSVGLRKGSCRFPPAVRANDIATTTVTDLRAQLAELAARHECLATQVDHISTRSLTIWPDDEKQCVGVSTSHHTEEDHHEDVF